MVEFGAPLKATLLAAQSMGLDFYCNTDHSYDLDDMPGSWTETDPKLRKWNNSRKEIDDLNKEFANSSLIIPSEELSLHNLDGRNIHALILNNSEFLPGSGDGAEEPFNFKSEYNTQNLYKALQKNALCIAAHPFNPVPIPQWLFFKRGKWKMNDKTIYGSGPNPKHFGIPPGTEGGRNQEDTQATKLARALQGDREFPTASKTHLISLGETGKPEPRGTETIPRYAGVDPSDPVYLSAQYPYVKIQRSESGHIDVIDDTLGGERLLKQHKTNLFFGRA